MTRSLGEDILTAMKVCQKSVCVIVESVDRLDSEQLFGTICENGERDTQIILKLLSAIYDMLEQFTCSACSSEISTKAVINSTFHFGYDEQLYDIIISIRFAGNDFFTVEELYIADILYDMFFGPVDQYPIGLELTSNLELLKHTNSSFAQRSEPRGHNDAGRYQLFRKVMDSFICMQIMNQEELRGMLTILTATLILENLNLEESKERVTSALEINAAFTDIVRLLDVENSSLGSPLLLELIYSYPNATRDMSKFFFQRLIGRLLEKINDSLRRTIIGRRRKNTLSADDKHRCSVMNEGFVEIFSLSCREKPDSHPFVRELKKIYKQKIKMDQDEYFVEGIRNIEKFVDQDASTQSMTASCITDLDTNDEEKLDLQETVIFLEKMESLLRSSKNPFIASLCSKNFSSMESNDAQVLIAELGDMILKDNRPTFFVFPAPITDDGVVDQVFKDAALVHEPIRTTPKVPASKFWRHDFAYRTSYPKFLMRYKCLSEYTWPNYRGGSIQDGVKIILQQHNLLNQCYFGYTKLFVKNWKTVQFLEHKRSRAIPHIATYLQKNWRGTCTRQKLKWRKMIEKIIFCYRKFKLRSYLTDIQRSLSTEHSKEVLHKDFSSWPDPPAFLTRVFVTLLKKVYNRWRSSIVISRIEKESIEDVKLKIYALPFVRDKRVNMKFREKWFSDYLADDDENVFSDEYIAALKSIKKQYPFARILFSSFIEKFNKRGRCTTRSILVTENQIFKLHAQGRSKFSPMKDGRDVSALRTVTVTSCNDGLVVLDFGDKNDFVFYFSRGGCRVVEFVGVLAAEIGKLHSRHLNVVIADSFKFHTGGRSKQMILVKNHDKSVDEPYFRSKISTVKFYWPLKELAIQ